MAAGSSSGVDAMRANADDWIDDGDIDFRALFERLFARRWFIVGCVGLSAILFFVSTFLVTPLYRAKVVAAPVSTDLGSSALSGALGQLGGLASIAGITVGSGGSQTEEALAVLRSREFTEKFINDNGLMPILFAKKWDASTGDWKQNEGTIPTSARAFRYFDTEVRSVAHDKKTGLVTLQIDWIDREQAADWANDQISQLNAEMKSRAIGLAEDSVGFLERELGTTSAVATRDAISRLIEAQVKQRMLANVSREYSFRVVDKALPPDADDRIKPRRLMTLLIGILVGLGASVAWVLLPVGREK